MLAKNKSGWTLLEYLNITENEIVKYHNVTGSYAILVIKERIVLGFNKWRKQWELPSGGIEDGETARQAAIRELYEETHQNIAELDFKGLIKVEDPQGIIKYQAVFAGCKNELSPFVYEESDEMEKICLWNMKEDIGYVDECDVKIVEIAYRLYDCGFTKEDNWFRYRAGAIIVEDECVLFAGNKNENYLYSIGGGVHMGETAEDAVLREVFEETGVHYEIDRLAVIHENFFKESGGVLKGLNCHEISFYFMMKPRGTKELHSNSTTYGGAKEEMHWIPISDLDKYRAFPSFMKDFLGREHFGIEHIVTDERK